VKGPVRAAWLIALLCASASLDAHADFNARGRSKKPPAASGKASGKAPSTPQSGVEKAKANGGAATPNKASESAAARSSAALMARYTALALQQPGSAFPVERLAQLYRERDGHLDNLVAEFSTRANGTDSESWNATLVLAAVLEQASKPEQALSLYEAAAQKRPTSPVPRLALARLLTARGDAPAARAALEAALPLLKESADIEQTKRSLRGLCLDVQDFAAAERYHKELIALAQGSFFVRAELGQELTSRGLDQLAEAEFRKLVEHAQGDNRASASALRELATVLGKQRKYAEALAALKRGLRLAPDSGLRRELLMLSAQLHRASGRSAELVAELEQSQSGDFEKLRLLAELYEESGQLDKALQNYSAALKRQPRDINTHLKVIQLLQLQGQLDRAIQESEKLVRTVPDNPDFTFHLAEALIQRGERPRALQKLSELERRSLADPDLTQSLVDFYEKIREDARALALLERAATGAPADTRGWIELGRRYYKAGDKERAERTWKRLLQAGQNKATTWQALGEVYSEHDMNEAALDAFRHAMRLAPNNPQYRKAYALALERSASTRSKMPRNRQYEEAQKIWETLLTEQTAPSHPLAREARQHIVTLWSLAGELSVRLQKLEQRVRANPNDLAAAQLLAEGQLRARRYADAERTLRDLRKRVPGDSSVHLALERVLVTQRKLPEAIAVVEDLVRIDPLRAREYYQRLSAYATELYQDDRAFTYAARVVELAPDDAESHRKLAEIHRRRQDSAKAIESLRIAIRKNDRLFPAYIELADLLINSNELTEADTLLRHVMRLSPDDEVVARASRTCIQINLGRGTLEGLENDLLPLSVSNPSRPVFRRMLLEVYRAIALSLPANDDPRYREALAKIERLGRRAVGPLLDALADDDESQQRAAIDLLTRIQNKHATPALLTYATSSTGDPNRRARAMLAIGSVNDPQTLPKLEAFLLSDGAAPLEEGDPVATSAVWAIAKQQSRDSSRLLQRILTSPIAQASGPIKALCALGLGAARDSTSMATLWRVTLDENELQLVRVAALQALADLGSTTHAEGAIGLTDLSDPTVRAVALLALARMAAPSVERLIARDLFSPNTEIERAAWAAAVVLTTKQYDPARALFSAPQDQVDVRTMLQATIPTGHTPDDGVRTLERMSSAIHKAAQEAVAGPAERALQVVQRLSSDSIVTSLEHASPALRERGQQIIEGLKQSLVPQIATLVQHPVRRVQLAALAFLVDREEPAARAAMLAALNGTDQQLSQATLQAVARSPSALDDPKVAESMAHLLKEPAPWPLRVKAAETLAVVGQTTGARAATQGSAARTLLAALENAAQHDSYALVRQSALQALKAIGGPAARSILSRAATSDPEGKVRAVARDLLGDGSVNSP
jgi:tetratricopeptide (TPR) repeat protein